MSIFPLQTLDGLFHDYGYGVIFAGVLLESTGLPLPGESLMIAAALYAATTHHLNIFVLVPLAAARLAISSAAGLATACWRVGAASWA
jgi:membrane protein DedA with SNARE-associated domain